MHLPNKEWSTCSTSDIFFFQIFEKGFFPPYIWEDFLIWLLQRDVFAIDNQDFISDNQWVVSNKMAAMCETNQYLIPYETCSHKMRDKLHNFFSKL